MRVEPQHSAELHELGSLIEAMSVTMLTTVAADGSLASRPMSPLEMDANGALWFYTDLRSEKVEHLRVINLSFSDAARGTYVSLSGRAEIDADRRRIERLWTPLARPWFPDGPASTNLALLKVVPTAAEYWDAPHSKMVQVLAMAASVVAGKPIGLGSHATIDGLSDTPPGRRAASTSN